MDIRVVGGVDHTGLCLKRSVCKDEASGACIHVVGVMEGGSAEGTGDREHSRLGVVFFHLSFSFF